MIFYDIPASGDGTAIGEVVCHCSEEDGVPDVGVSIGLGGGAMLWLGELLARDGGDIGLVFHGPDDVRVVAPLWPSCEWQDAADILRHHVAPLIAATDGTFDGVEAALATIPAGWSWSLGQMMGLPLDRRYRCFLTDHSRDPSGIGTHHLDRDRASPVEAIYAALAYGREVWPDSPAIRALPKEDGA